MQLFNTSSIVQLLNKQSCPTTKFWKILTENTIRLEQLNTKQKLQILEVLHIRNKHPKLNRINFESRANIFKFH